MKKKSKKSKVKVEVTEGNVINIPKKMSRRIPRRFMDDINDMYDRWEWRRD